LIDDEFLASIGCPTDSGFAQPEVLANLSGHQARIQFKINGRNGDAAG